ncbi:MAG: restriction endonuclease subunit S [Planctomycetaceae bacterium]
MTVLRERFTPTDIGPSPLDWRAPFLSEVSSLITNGFVGTATPHYTDNTGVRYLYGTNIRANRIDLAGLRYVTHHFDELESKTRLQAGDLLTVQSGHIGTTAVVPIELEGANCHALIVTRLNKDEVDPIFLSQYLNSEIGVARMRGLEVGSTILHINTKDLKRFRIPRPPLPEQQKIAAILSTWDRAIELTEKLIAAKQKRKQALMQQLLTGKVRFKEFAKRGEWRMTKLGSVTVKVGSGITPRGGQSTYLASGVPFIRSQNVLSGKLDLTDVVYLSEEQNSQMANSQVLPLDVLLNITGASIGRCAKVPAGFPNANVNQHVCIIRPKETLDPDYLSNLLNSWFGQKLVFQSQAGGNREGLNYEQIRSFRLVLPPIAEQRRLGEILAALDAEIEVLHRKLDRLKQQKKGLMQQLLTGKVRVKVDSANQ